MAQIQQNKGSKHVAIGLTVIFLTIGALLTPLAIAYFSGSLSSSPSTETQLASCLNSANSDYTSKWNAADNDGDGKLSYDDGSSSITTSYYDSAIACYRSHKTADSEGNISDLQMKRQQEVDKYTAWLQSSQNNRKSIMCTSSVTGSTMFTNCY